MRWLWPIAILLGCPAVWPAPPEATAAPPTLQLPAEVRGEPGTFIAIHAESDAAWVNFRGSDGLAVFPPNMLADRKATVVTSANGGTFKLFAYTGNVEGGMDGTITIVIAAPLPVPPPQPPGPGPTPPPTPTPTPPPVVDGKRAVLIVHESSRDTPAFSRLINSLREGPQRAYLRSKGHTLSLLDQDDKNENGQPSPIVEAWRPHFSGMTLPVLIILDRATTSLLDKQTLPDGATADYIVNLVKAKGG